MRKLLATTALMLALGLSSGVFVYAQDSGSTGTSQGGAGSGNNTDSDTGGTTGALTTTPEAKSDDAAGTRATSAPPVATPSGTETGDDHGCTVTQMWDATKMACVPK